MWKLKKYVVRPIILSFLWPSLDQLEHTIVPNGNAQLCLFNNSIMDKVSNSLKWNLNDHCEQPQKATLFMIINNNNRVIIMIYDSHQQLFRNKKISLMCIIVNLDFVTNTPSFLTSSI